MIQLDALILDPANVRAHPARNLEAIKGSLKRFGQIKPIVVDADGVVVAGNGLVEAARALGWSEIRVIRTKLKGSDRTAYAIADNRTAELAEWTSELAAALASLADEAALETWATGFSQDELDALIADLTEPMAVVEDEVPDIPVKSQTRLGDLWTLGDHRVLCGDSTKAEDVARVMDGGKADSVLTDSPYGVGYEGKTKAVLTIANDGNKELADLLDKSLSAAFGICKLGAVWFVAAPPGPQVHVFGTALLKLGVWRQLLVWVKNAMVLGHSDFHYRHEFLFYGWKPGGEHHVVPDRIHTSVWEFDKPSASCEHPTMKPLDLFAKAIEHASKPGDVVFDPFLGSGTTLTAAEQLGRKCYGLEIEPKYCDVICRRWMNATNGVPVRQDGAEFEG